MLDVFAYVVQLHSNGDVRLHEREYFIARHLHEVADGEVRVDNLQQADELERREHRSVDDLLAHDGDLKRADRRSFDGTELFFEERRHPLTDVVLAEAVLAERPGDTHC